MPEVDKKIRIAIANRIEREIDSFYWGPDPFDIIKKKIESNRELNE